MRWTSTKVAFWSRGPSLRLRSWYLPICLWRRWMPAATRRVCFHVLSQTVTRCFVEASSFSKTAPPHTPHDWLRRGLSLMSQLNSNLFVKNTIVQNIKDNNRLPERSHRSMLAVQVHQYEWMAPKSPDLNLLDYLFGVLCLIFIGVPATS